MCWTTRALSVGTLPICQINSSSTPRGERVCDFVRHAQCVPSAATITFCFSPEPIIACLPCFGFESPLGTICTKKNLWFSDGVLIVLISLACGGPTLPCCLKSGDFLEAILDLWLHEISSIANLLGSPKFLKFFSGFGRKFIFNFYFISHRSPAESCQVRQPKPTLSLVHKK